MGNLEKACTIQSLPLVTDKNQGQQSETEPPPPPRTAHVRQSKEDAAQLRQSKDRGRKLGTHRTTVGQ